MNAATLRLAVVPRTGIVAGQRELGRRALDQAAPEARARRVGGDGVGVHEEHRAVAALGLEQLGSVLSAMHGAQLEDGEMGTVARHPGLAVEHGAGAVEADGDHGQQQD